MKKFLKSFQKWRENLKKSENIEPILPPPPAENAEKMTVEISLFSVFKATLVVVGVLFLSKIFLQLLDVIVIFLVALFLAAALSPAVDFFQKRFPVLIGVFLSKVGLLRKRREMLRWEMPRAVAIVLVFALLFGFLILFFGNLIPIIIEQLKGIAISLENWARSFAQNPGGSGFSQKIHEMVGLFLEKINTEKILGTVSENLQSIANNFSDFVGTSIDFILGTVSVLLKIVLTLLLTFFLIFDRQNLNDFFYSLFPARHQKYLVEKMALVQIKIGEWVHGQFLLFLIVGGFAFLGLHFLLGLDYSLTLAMVFGLAEFVPYLGPITAFLVSAPIAFNAGTGTGIGLIIFVFVLQFFESNFLVPLVMRRAVGLPPVVTMMALVIGASFPDFINPILGMILAVPVATIFSIFVRDFTGRKK